MAVRERCENQLRQRLQLSQAKLAESETEIGELRKVSKTKPISGETKERNIYLGRHGFVIGHTPHL